ncbi:MAG: hypothetical protein A2Y62_03970 [Candidatus Fischerbacteria bacterium RBG_13_37_8]|uniref:Uncharacterized protein n=1 Tax=Candidatus Fischerbacteria bacterium RBG_13_37_8 TaxID=1817863 RepID=A0A1F5V5J0_9BACT|nr:MAG: hypothetical protein A2Y62_03970 [Candidatus Fischerbacteria bacterium RBG_13_37_8]
MISNCTTIKDIITAVVAVMILLCFVWFVKYMLGLVAIGEKEWARALYLFTGVEAIAFAAAGFFFGGKINHVRAEKAEERAENAEKRANANQEEAVKAKGLVEAVKSKGKTHDSKVAIYNTLVPQQAIQLMQEDIKELTDLANKLFP